MKEPFHFSASFFHSDIASTSSIAKQLNLNVFFLERFRFFFQIFLNKITEWTFLPMPRSINSFSNLSFKQQRKNSIDHFVRPNVEKMPSLLKIRTNSLKYGTANLPYAKRRNDHCYGQNLQMCHSLNFWYGELGYEFLKELQPFWFLCFAFGKYAVFCSGLFLTRR